TIPSGGSVTLTGGGGEPLGDCPRDVSPRRNAARRARTLVRIMNGPSLRTPSRLAPNPPAQTPDPGTNAKLAGQGRCSRLSELLSVCAKGRLCLSRQKHDYFRKTGLRGLRRLPRSAPLRRRAAPQKKHDAACEGRVGVQAVRRRLRPAGPV